ncbi:hypothetical protein [Methyloceanibacter caenitepidi]|uniref:Uncharacterized protein n=1 Tax=Methyloceanibacter caenitepidi TaxID=1384459 RepID=A0A0A8K8C9_9HYPH|nr:hypothetical protein [Methyloceanibacter caenitepidi]BAQ18244.1 hypothetical protein GL4_2810 [Methyloceanibacter caenitepidi]
MDLAKGDRERYETVFKLLEYDFVETAQEFDSPKRQAEAAARANSDFASEKATQSGVRER